MSSLHLLRGSGSSPISTWKPAARLLSAWDHIICLTHCISPAAWEAESSGRGSRGGQLCLGTPGAPRFHSDSVGKACVWQRSLRSPGLKGRRGWTAVCTVTGLEEEQGAGLSGTSLLLSPKLYSQQSSPPPCPFCISGRGSACRLHEAVTRLEPRDVLKSLPLTCTQGPKIFLLSVYRWQKIH